MHFGRIAEDPDKDPSDGTLAYQSEDGVWHKLQVVTDSDLCAPHATPCHVTRDGSWIRAKHIGDPGHWLLWTPDGIERELTKYIAKGWACSTPPPPECPQCPPGEASCEDMDDFYGWYTTKIYDPTRTGSVTVVYEPSGPLEHCILQVSDSVRSTTIDFENDTVDGQDGSRGGLTREVRAQTAAGQATYRLHNAATWISPERRVCDQTTPSWSYTPVNLLDAIVLELGPTTTLETSFKWVAEGVDPSLANGLVHEVDLPGELARAQYTWACEAYSYRETSQSPCWSDPVDVPMCQEKKVLRGTGDGCGDPDVDCWTYGREFTSGDRTDYSPCGTPVVGGCPPPTNPNKVTVTLPNTVDGDGNAIRHQRIHYFTAGYDICDNQRCPHPAPAGYKNGLEREVVYKTGNVETQKVFQEYETDGYPGCTTTPSDGPNNVRLKKTRVEFLRSTPCPGSDRFYERAMSGYDGFGHDQVVVERTNEGLSGDRARRTVTDYLHTSEDKEEWVLGRVAQRRVFDSEDELGALQLDHVLQSDRYGRLWKETRKGLHPDAADVVVHHGWTGHQERCTAWSGGDSGIQEPLLDGSGHVRCDHASLGCKPDHTIDRAYAIEQSYDEGGVDRGSVTRRAFKGLGFNLQRLERSAASSAVVAEHDTIDRYSNRFVRDKAERVTRVEYYDGATSSHDEEHLNVRWSGAARIDWDRGVVTGQEPAGVVKYDAYGRRRQVKVYYPESPHPLVKPTFTDALGNVQCVGDWASRRRWTPFAPAPPTVASTRSDGRPRCGKTER